MKQPPAIDHGACAMHVAPDRHPSRSEKMKGKTRTSCLAFHSRGGARVRLLAAVVLALGAAGAARADVVTDWNEFATAIGAAAQPNPLHQSRVYAMTQAAVHDALNAIDRRYRPYAYKGAVQAEASPEAAVAAAAYGVLHDQLPAQQMAIAAEYQTALAAIPEGDAKTAGIAVGEAAAAAVLARRSMDGSASANVPYTQLPGPGIWEPTPPNFVPAVLPGWGDVTTFALVHGKQFRPAMPEYFALAGAQYAQEYHEVQDIGSFTSTTRTLEQSDIARFWYEGSQLGWNRIARIIGAQRDLSLWENARLLALVNFALADGYIAGLNAKYHYVFWRPITAIQKGDTDGNSSTVADPSWSAFLITPFSPDYPSTHSILGAAAAEVLRRFIGTDFAAFEMTSGAPFPGITRSYTSLSEAALENANSRVLAGIHFRTATTDGLRMGQKIGKFVFKHSLAPVKKPAK
jgi:hypothetical protein